MLKIRLKRMGRKGQSSYRIVVTESRFPRNGRAVADLGYYNPRTEPTTFEINKDEATSWIAKGAQPTDTVAQYFVKAGIIKALKRGSKKPKTEKKTKNTEE